jgi:hypothetical protein
MVLQDLKVFLVKLDRSDLWDRQVLMELKGFRGQRDHKDLPDLMATLLYHSYVQQQLL